ncbi:hypothetical protein TNCV_3510951 [Trichonephila clavipes]|nr:hypothetical protein TNCV_3510951 [Trichonephila clavipes]
MWGSEYPYAVQQIRRYSPKNNVWRAPLQYTVAKYNFLSLIGRWHAESQLPYHQDSHTRVHWSFVKDIAYTRMLKICHAEDHCASIITDIANLTIANMPGTGPPTKYPQGSEGA